MDAVLGIDIAKAKLRERLLTPDGRLRHKSCANTSTGLADSARGCSGRAGQPACMRAGSDGHLWRRPGDLAAYDAGHVVSVVNPAIIHAYARRQLARSKTDRIDAVLIARFTATQRPAAWTSLALEIRELQALVRRLEACKACARRKMNRLAAGGTGR